MEPNLAAVSAHEGQVCLVADFSNTSIERSKLEDIMLDLLTVDGSIYAYQKQAATEAGTVKLIAEFVDVTSAERVIDRLNGKIMRVSKENV